MHRLTRMPRKPTEDSIRDTLYAAVGDEPTGWSALCDAVRHKVRRNGWMAVRGHLQGLIDDGLVARVGNVHVEEYVRVGSSTP